MSDGIIIGIDTGGTFTDVTILDRRNGVIRTAKTPTTPQDPSQGFASAAQDGLAVMQATPAEVSRVLHGTTVATNLILEGKGPPVAMLVTAGFRAVLEIGRQDIPRSGSLFEWVKPKRPVPPRLIWEIPGRIDRLLQTWLLTEHAAQCFRNASRQIAVQRSRGGDSNADPTAQLVV